MKGEVPLNHDSILKVGPLTFKVVIEKTAPIDKPTPPPAKKAAGNEEDMADMLLSLQGKRKRKHGRERKQRARRQHGDGHPSLPPMTLGGVPAKAGTPADRINDAAPANRRT